MSTEENQGQVLTDTTSVRGDVVTDYVRKGKRRGLHGQGLPRKTYFGPDGTTREAIPQFFSGTIEGKPVTVDRMITEGWSDKPFREPYKISCTGCSRWHDTQEEVADCKRQPQALVDKFNAQHQKKKDQVEILEARVNKMDSKLDLILKALEGNNGA